MHQICSPVTLETLSHGKLVENGWSCFSEAVESSEFLHAPWLNLGTCDTVDGSEIRREHQLRLVVCLSHYLQGFGIHPTWLAGFLPSVAKVS